MGKDNLAFAVAQVRSLENSLLTKSNYEQILAATDEGDITDILAAHGYVIPEDIKDIGGILDFNRELVWDLLSGLADGKDELEIFRIKNDYHNLKTVIKSFREGKSPDGNLLFPSNSEADILKTAITEKKYELLPASMRKAAEEAYEAVVSANDGQTAEIIIDRYALKAFLALAEKTDSKIVREYCLLTVETADIKTAVRGANTKKGEEFYKKALCGSPRLEKRALILAARKGAEEIISLLSATGKEEEAEALKNSVYDLEKLYDAKVIALMQNAIYVNFEVDPLIAYGIKKENEIKNIRIAIACRNMGIASAAMERMCIPDV